MTAMPPADQLRALDRGAEVHHDADDAGRPDGDHDVRRRRGEGAAGFHGRPRRAADASSQTLVVGEGQGFDETAADASAADTGAAFGQDDSEFNIFNTDRQLSALQTAAKMLGQLNEKKSLIYFASGLRLNGVDNQAQLHATINAAIRAGVSFWPIDARGLVASAPLGDATRARRAASACIRRVRAGGRRRTSSGRRTRCALAADTGGKALLDNNDLAKGIVQAQKAISSYYIIGYYTTNAALDGKFRRIKITLQRRAAGQARLSARATTPARSSASSPRPTRNGSWKTR